MVMTWLLKKKPRWASADGKFDILFIMFRLILSIGNTPGKNKLS